MRRKQGVKVENCGRFFKEWTLEFFKNCNSNIITKIRIKQNSGEIGKVSIPCSKIFLESILMYLLENYTIDETIKYCQDNARCYDSCKVEKDQIAVAHFISEKAFVTSTIIMPSKKW